MTKKDEAALDALVRDAEELLGHIGDTDRLVADLPDKTVADINAELRRIEFESLDRSDNPQIDARVEIRVSPDHMLCEADFFPAASGGRPLELEEVERLLAARGIVSGVDWNVIRRSIVRCNTEGIAIDSVVIAEGKKAVPEIPEHFLMRSRLVKPPAPQETKTGRIDHKERSPFVLVEPGELLAKRIRGQRGQSGSTVFGAELPPPKKRITVLTPGKNTRADGDAVFATTAGRLAFKRRNFFVSSILDIPDDVDYSTGNIDFDGDVIVHGDVLEGFDVKATGSVYCERTMSASQIECGGDLIITRGIIGRKKGEVRVGGKLRCKYIEHCHVEAGGTITALVGIMNSVVRTDGGIETGSRGIVVGGKLYAQNGVSVTQIGTSMGPATEIYCGVDHTVFRRLEWLRDRNIALATKLTEIRGQISTLGDSSGKLTALARQLQQAVRKLNSASVALVGHLDKNEAAAVVVRDTVYPNTYIEICRVSFVVSRVMRAVTFRLDRAQGKIVSVPLR